MAERDPLHFDENDDGSLEALESSHGLPRQARPRKAGVQSRQSMTGDGRPLSESRALRAKAREHDDIGCRDARLEEKCNHAIEGVDWIGLRRVSDPLDRLTDRATADRSILIKKMSER